ncbi:hypothetical protein [Pelagibacterium montanilacus]|uniref:hypothetical protein n=1 Tax=Pelagibacterium montanilacus TaxID=2185280 RepID=UPI000F8E0471|nr:hypothetical protein [Pelagibacterium montanilacus]
MAWGIFKDMCWRVRSAGLGVVGVELGPAVERLVRAGLEPEDAEDLLMACERGFVAAVNEKDDEQ